MIDENGSQQDFQQDDIEWAAFRKAADQPSFHQLHNPDCRQGYLLVPFHAWRQKRQPEQEKKPDGIQPAKPSGPGFRDRGLGNHAASIQPQKALPRQFESDLIEC